MNKLRGLKMIVAILVILALPFLFFRFLGGNLLAFNETKKPTIAVVNEDLGDTRDEEKIEMGKEVVSILAEDSPYEWKVVSRGAAESGLASTDYEAIVYIPSNFSENVMSYEQPNPQKAEFDVDVQDIKSAAAKEQLLNEINKSTNRVNEGLSTLYWSYVAIEMDHIKSEFENILDKEIEFLDAMSSYYSSGSEALKEQFENQKTLIEGMHSSLEGAQDSGTTARNVDAFESQLEDFVGYVQSYKDFQAEQREILIGLQDTNLAKIQEAAVRQVEQYQKTLEELSEHNDKLTAEIEKVDEQLEKQKESFEQLSDLRKEAVDRQVRDLLLVQGKAFDRYNESLLNRLEQKITEAQNGNTQSGPGLVGETIEKVESNVAEMEQKAVEKSHMTPINLADEQQRIDELQAVINGLKEGMQKIDPNAEAMASLADLETELVQLKESLAKKGQSLTEMSNQSNDDYLKVTNDYIDLYEHYQTVYDKYLSVNEVIQSYSGDTARLLYEIEEVEYSILRHEDLTNERREQLRELFNRGVGSTDTSTLLAYYANLVQFELILNERVQEEDNGKEEVLKDELMESLFKNAVDLSEQELQGWTSVSDSFPETATVVDGMNTSFAAILTGFEESVEMQHTGLLNNLSSIEEQASALLSQIQEPSGMIPSGEPVQNTGESEVVSGQLRLGSELLSLSSLVDSLSERQNRLVSQANDLHVKANDLETTTTEFSGLWGTNLNAMSVFREDIEDFLANTYVDGQVNGYAFSHFVNPLQVNGEAMVAGEQSNRVPPVILYIIMLISSLLVGYFVHRLKGGSGGLRLGMLGLLSVLVGVIISLYSVNMYSLSDDRAIQWTIFTVLLLLASAAIIHTTHDIGQTVGWLASIVMMCLYMVPLLVLGVAGINIPDLLTPVYHSIKYEAETYFALGSVVAGIIAAAMMITSYVLGKRKAVEPLTEEQSYEG